MFFYTFHQSRTGSLTTDRNSCKLPLSSNLMESLSSSDVNYRNVDSSGSTLAADISRLFFLTHTLCKQSITAGFFFFSLDCFPTSDFLKFNYFVLDD